jgi:cell division protein FtsW
MTENGATHSWDGAVVLSALGLTAFGVLMNYSTTAALAIGDTLPPLALRHVAGVAFAIVCGMLAARAPLGTWRRLSLWLWAATVFLLLCTLLFGVEANGAKRWLLIPGIPFAIQAAEPAKLATALAVASLLAGTSPKNLGSLALLKRITVLVAAPVGLLLLQPDFGSAVMLCAVVGFVLFAAGMPLRVLAMPLVAGALGAALYIAVRPYAAARVRGFVDPYQTAHAEGFQLVQSFVAFARGGAFGLGLGNGLQKLSYLPEAHTDFILSMVAEEVGLFGVLIVLGGFAALCFAGLRIAGRAREPFALLAASACTGLVVIPAICNAAVVMGLVPTKGLTLPFLSHGTNSLLCSAIAIGILLRAGRDATAPATGGFASWSRTASLAQRAAGERRPSGGAKA